MGRLRVQMVSSQVKAGERGNLLKETDTQVRGLKSLALFRLISKKINIPVFGSCFFQFH